MAAQDQSNPNPAASNPASNPADSQPTAPVEQPPPTFLELLKKHAVKDSVEDLEEDGLPVLAELTVQELRDDYGYKMLASRDDFKPWLNMLRELATILPDNTGYPKDPEMAQMLYNVDQAALEKARNEQRDKQRELGIDPGASARRDHELKRYKNSVAGYTNKIASTKKKIADLKAQLKQEEKELRRATKVVEEYEQERAQLDQASANLAQDPALIKLTNTVEKLEASMEALKAIHTSLGRGNPVNRQNPIQQNQNYQNTNWGSGLRFGGQQSSMSAGRTNQWTSQGQAGEARYGGRRNEHKDDETGGQPYTYRDLQAPQQQGGGRQQGPRLNW